MGLYFTLTLAAWLAGGLVCSPWIFWLDRERGEFGGPVKVAVLFAWPLLMPLLLYKREDVTGLQAGRNVALALALLAAGPSYEAFSRPGPPEAVTVKGGVITGTITGGVPYDPDAVIQRRIGEQRASSYFYSAMAKYQRQEFEEAVLEFQRCLSLDPAHDRCLAGLKFARNRQGVAVITEDDRNQALRHWNAGIIAFQAGDYARARELWLACLNRDPKNSDCSTGLARVDAALTAVRPGRLPSENDKREAIRYWNSGIIYYQRGDFEKARDEWQRCRSLDRDNSECKTGLQRIEQSYGAAP